MFPTLIQFRTSTTGGVFIMSKAIDITGQKFGRLTALKPTENRNSRGSIMWLCKCECGTIKEICIADLRNKGTKSCGCLSREKASQRFKELTKEERSKMAMKDITGQRFGKLIAIKPTDKRNGTNVIWELKCDCGNITYADTGNLGDGSTRSCGCLLRDTIFIDLTGQKFSRLTVLREDGHIGNRIAWECKCDCGNITRVDGGHLKSGSIQSCGCIRDELAGENHPNYNPNKTDEERLKKRYILGKHTIDEFRNKVYQRDEYTCRVCGQVGGTLNAHHLDGWNWAKDKRFKISNGVTLCEDCHNKFHNIYGKGHNTKEQFEEFKRFKEIKNII